MGIYCGIILVMLLYNFFVYISVKDRSYLFYVFYIFIVGLTQLNYQGYAQKYLWPNSTIASSQAVFVLTSLVAIAAIEFMKVFLHTKDYSIRLHNRFKIFILIYVVALILSFTGYYTISYPIIQLNAFLVAVYMISFAIRIMSAGYAPAKFFLIAWVTFLVGVCVFVMKDYQILPYNNVTYYMMMAGSGFEVILLSFALADKINVYRKEKEQSQAEALRISKENEIIIREQNVMLEQKVEERTHDLNEANVGLSTALKDLKLAQTKLVDAEKMASLGQLTAGIAHEINNPINFVSSNINPLRRDIEDILTIIHKYDETIGQLDVKDKFSEIDSLKEELDFNYLKHEIDTLLKGMGDGASRTVEIVKGLKSFSRIDESDLKFANLNDGIESTLVLLNTSIKGKINVIKDFGNIPEIECYAGKLNQVFMNIISNAAQAINTESHTSKGEIYIGTRQEGDKVVVRIKDNGSGMPEEVKARIFEPFFTTKKAGEGTGLGLSIVFSIIDMHRGDIAVESEPGKGTEFIITLPVLQSK